MSVLAVDLGASGGRVLLADGERLTEIHRFDNAPLRENGRLMWDYQHIFKDVRNGIRKAAEAYAFDSVGIDTWGVDFAVVSQSGDIVYPPAHYRDELNAPAMAKALAVMGEEALYARTGVPAMPINTLVQLFALKDVRPDVFHKGNRILLMPDFLKWLLTGEMGADVTMAATTQLLNPFSADWDFDLIERLGFPAQMFPAITKSGAMVKREHGLPNLPVFSVGHDTACAAIAANSGLFISCGTWSIVGLETETPIINDAARALGAAVEINHGGKPLLLRNITGLWIIQQLRRELGGVGYSEMERQARASAAVYTLDPDDESFSAEGAMRPRILAYCRKTGQAEPRTDGELIRGVYAGLAAKYGEVAASMEQLAGGTFDAIHIVGGGAQSALLLEMTEAAAGKRVTAGHIEATAIGNALAQREYTQGGR